MTAWNREEAKNLVEISYGKTQAACDKGSGSDCSRQPERSSNAFDQCFMHDDKFVRGTEFGELRPNALQEHEQVTQAHVADAQMYHFWRWVG